MAIQDLRGILQYVQQFRGRTFVIAVDGGVVLSGGMSPLVLDLAVLRSLNVHVVLVHGARAQINALAAQRGVELSNDDGLGPTDDVTLDISISAISRMNSELLSELGVAELRAVSPNAITARPAGIVGGVEQQHTGRIDKIDAEALHSLIEQGMLPVISPLAHNKTSRKFRLNSDEVAIEVAIALKASKLIFLSEDICQKPGEELVVQLTVNEARDRGATESLPEGVRSKLKFAARACEGGVPRAHILNGALEDALLGELFSNEGVGTMVYADEYLTIRPAEASDVPEMVWMMRGAIEDGQLLGREASEIEASLQDFFVAVIDGNTVGCIAFHLYEDAPAVGELACLYIKKSHADRGYGKLLVKHIENLAVEKGLSHLFLLSTQSYSYFSEKLGFALQDDFPLPPARQAKRESSARNARVLVKAL